MRVITKTRKSESKEVAIFTRRGGEDIFSLQSAEKNARFE